MREGLKTWGWSGRKREEEIGRMREKWKLFMGVEWEIKGERKGENVKEKLK